MISFSRIAAAFTVIVVFTLIIVVTIQVTLSVGTQITHGSMVEHQHGVVLSKSSADNSLMFKTDNGQIMHFACTQRCLVQLGHIQRHIQEHAGTDVYYKQENNTFVAVDVD
jgi:hypothetical protein